MTEEKQYYSVLEAVKATKMTKQRIYYEISNGFIETVMIAGHKAIPVEEIKKMKERKVLSKKHMSANEYCSYYNLTRNQFNYRVRAGYIKTFKQFGKILIDEEWS